MSEKEVCPVESVGRAIGGKWKMRIRQALLLRQRLRYNELLREIPDISPKELTRDLRSMEEQGLAERDGESVEQCVDYRVSTMGLELGPIFERLGVWGSRYQQRLAHSD